MHLDALPLALRKTPTERRVSQHLQILILRTVTLSQSGLRRGSAKRHCKRTCKRIAIQKRQSVGRLLCRKAKMTNNCKNSLNFETVIRYGHVSQHLVTFHIIDCIH